MASMSKSRPAPAPRAISASTTTDPILRNALRYTISAKEYALLHRYIISRSRLLEKRAPSVDTVAKIINHDAARDKAHHRSADVGSRKGPDEAKRYTECTRRGNGSSAAATSPPSDAQYSSGGDEYNVRAIRHTARVFLVASLGMKLYDVLITRLTGHGTHTKVQSRSSLHPRSTRNLATILQSPSLRLGLSLSTILLLYRILFRFLARLRQHILDVSALPFRQRNPRAARVLTWAYAPAVGASFAGLGLGVYPAQQLRVSIAVYTLFRALEFGWNCVEDEGLVWGIEVDGKGKGNGAEGVRKLKERPWWFGSWLLQPFAFGQLLSAVVFDRDCFPAGYGDFIFKQSKAYIQPRPKSLASGASWPKTYDVVDGLAQMARLNWPPYVSPALFPNKADILSPSLSAIAPISSAANPLITSLSCATLHPNDPSCLRTSFTFWIRSFPPIVRFFLLVNTAFLIPKYRRFYDSPFASLNHVAMRALSMSTFVTGSIATAWASICFFQTWLPRTLLSTQRFFLGGFIAGLWAWIERKTGRSVFLYSARTSIDSLWKVGVKRRWWKAMKGGDVWVFVAALMITGVVYERDARAIREANWRKGVSWVRGQGYEDWAVEESDEEESESEMMSKQA